MEKMLETALRNKFRWNTARGKFGVEEMWHMPLDSKDGFNLDTVATELDNEIEKTGKRSRLKRDSKATKLQTKLKIIEYIMETKQNEIEEKESELIRKGKKEKIRLLIEKKRDGALEEKSLEELEQMEASI